jgi:hypothetical protein
LQVFAAPESKLCELLSIYKKQQVEKETPEILEEKIVTTSIVAKFVKLVVQVNRSSDFFNNIEYIQIHALGSKTSQIRKLFEYIKCHSTFYYQHVSFLFLSVSLRTTLKYECYVQKNP